MLPTRHAKQIAGLALISGGGFMLQAQQLTAPPSSSPLNYTTNWIGNSFSGSSSQVAQQHVPLDIQGLYVTSDGSVYTNTGWDEGGRAVSIFNNGQLTNGTSGNAGGQAIVAANGLVFASQSTGLANNPPCAAGGCGVAVLSSDGTQNAGSLSGDSNLPNTGHIYGMATYNNSLYVAVDDYNTVDVFDLNSLTLTNQFSITDPVLIAIDSQGGMWISHKDHTPLPNVNGVVYDYFGDFGLSNIDHYDNNGNYINTINLPDNAQVSALWIDGNDTLYAGDQNQDENIKIYTNILSSPTLSSTFGIQGGIYANNPGVYGPLEFRNITGIATDGSGNIYISDDDYGHGVILSSYTLAGSLNWQVFGLDFVSLASIDPQSETDAYDAYHHFQINYGNQPGNIGTYFSDTYNPFQYPDDLRTSSTSIGTAQIQYVQGHKFLLVSNQAGVAYEIYRFNPGSEIAVPCVAFDYGAFQGQDQDFAVQPDDGEFIWRDLNGDGQMTTDEILEPSNNSHRDGQDFWMDSNGDVWQVNYLSSVESSIHVRRYFFQGFDSYGAPIYDYNHMAVYNQSSDLPATTDISRVIFQPGDSDGGTLYVAGSSTGTGAFSQVARYDNWDQGNRTASWVANIPWNSDPNNQVIPNSISETGNYFFVDFNYPHYVLVYSTADGSYVGEIDPGDNVGGSSGIGNDDEWTSTSVYQRSNGQYVIMKEEDFQAKVLAYVWTPPGVSPDAQKARVKTMTAKH